MGYESGHFVTKMNEPAETLKITILPRKNEKTQRPSGFYCDIRVNEKGLSIPVYVPFKASGNSLRNELAATIHRFGCKMPRVESDTQEDFRAFCRLLIPKFWTDTVQEQDVLGWGDFLKTTNYPGARKSYFTRLLNGLYSLDEKTCVVKSFIKDEEYSEPKNARAINSYCDSSKVILGPVCHAIDKKTFAKKVFIKGMDIKNLPQRMSDVFENHQVYNTDFTSMEAHHQGVYAYVIYFWMMHMTRHLTGSRWLRAFLARLTLGCNDIKFRHIRVQIIQRLMSGAFWTSSANGVLNFLMISYLSARCKFPDAPLDFIVDWVLKDFVGLFEGDDGLFPVYAPEKEYAKLITKMGVRLKLEKKNNYSEAGFCSMTCTTIGTIVKEPFKTLQNFFILPMKYCKAKKSIQYGLLRARALSYLYLFPSAPIVSALCHAVLRDTKSYTARFDLAVQSYFMRHETDLIQRKEKELRQRVEIRPEERLCVQNNFNIDIGTQLEMEKSFDSPAPYQLHLLPYCSRDRIWYASNFVTFNPDAWISPEPKNTSPILLPFLQDHTKKDKPPGRFKSALPTHIFEEVVLVKV